MKNRFNLTFHHSQTLKFSFLSFFFFAILGQSNLVQAQQTLCQQLGGNFTPNITIGTDTSSITKTGDLLGITGWTNQKVLVNGTLVINSNFLISSCTLKMGKNAIIRIDPNITFQSVLSKYFRCGGDLWKGFVAMGGTASFWFNHIEDANKAIEITSANASLVIVGNNINRNRRGVYAQNIVVNAIVAANTFNCSSLINGTLSSLSFAGIELSNCPSATIGRTDNVPGYRNVFKKQSYGIRLINQTTTDIGLSTFYKNTVGVYLKDSRGKVQGVNANLTTNFALNGNDIYANASGLEVFNCYLDSCKNTNITSEMNNNREQVHIYDNTIHVTNEPSPTNSKFGISLDRSKFGDDGQFRNTIDRNHLVIHDFGENKRRGMHIRGGASIHDFMRVDSNVIEAFTGGDSDIQTKFVDIDISGADNFHITNNTITSTNTFPEGNNRWGFFMVNGAMTPAEGNLFWTNNILGIGPDDGCCAMHAEDAGPWSICNNTTNGTYRGFHFIGNCGKSAFGVNTIGNHNYDPHNMYVGGTGLFLQGHGADNVFLGKQECQANYWDVVDYSDANAFAAIIIGNDLNGPSGNTLLKNEFLVGSLSDPHQAPIDRNPMQNWFKTGDCLQPSGCVEPDVNNFDEHDAWIRDYYPYPQASPGVEEWQSTRYVLAKLMRYPNLATSGSTLAFKNAYGQSSAALFARFDSLMSVISSATTGSQTNLNSLNMSIQNKQAQINALDATIDLSSYTTIPTGYLSSRATLLGELATLSDQRSYLLAQNASTRTPLLTACEQFNNALPGNQVYEQNQKILNALAIKQARSIELTQADKDALHAIAQQCTQIAGRTRAAAAAMLPPEEGVQYWRENPDDYNCQQRVSRDAGSQDTGFLLSPNPSSDILHIQFDVPFMGDLVISDLSGRVVQQQSVHDKIRTLDIPVTQLDNGTYLLSCTSSIGKLPQTTKFVVLR